MTFETMGLMNGADVLHKISLRLEESHLAYLQLDDSPSKIQARQKLEGFIKEYLCLVPNEMKYVFQETASILHRSAVTLKEFSAYRACSAWRAVSLYAANLLAQPWRKEYRTLRTYSGYYKHEIEAHLIGAELMFELMGYKHTGFGVLTLEGPIDPDRVSHVSRDAIVAFVECQIVKEIWESVSQNFTVSWLEVLEFRWNSVGTSEQAIRALNFRFRERLHHRQEKIALSPCHLHCDPPLIYMNTTMIRSIVPTSVSSRAITNNYNVCTLPTTSKPDSTYQSDEHIYSRPIGTASLANRCSNHHIYGTPINNFYPTIKTNMANPMTMQLEPSRAVRMPTDNLIQLHPRVPIASYEVDFVLHDDVNITETKKNVQAKVNQLKMNEVDNRHSSSIKNFNRDIYENYIEIKKCPRIKTSRSNFDIKNNDWEFVYKSLESLGYSKDLGERDDVLKKKESMLDSNNSTGFQKHTSITNIDKEDNNEKDIMQKSNLDANDGKMGSTMGTKNKEITINDSNPEYFVNGLENPLHDCLEFSKISSFDMMESVGSISNNKKCGKQHNSTMPRSRNVDKSVTHGSSMMLESDSMKDDRQSSPKHELKLNKWNCGTCTFLNLYVMEICEMCGKSRWKGNEDKPLASGGKECPQCTLVNEKNAYNCEACSASLKDSPTYI